MSSKRRLNRKYAGTATGGILAVVLIVVVGYLSGAYIFNVLPKIPGTTQASIVPTPGVPQTTPQGTLFWVGDVTPSIRGTDTLISGTNYQCGGALVCRWFYNRGAGYVNTGIQGNSTFYLDPLDKGIIFLEVDSQTNANLYQDVQRTLGTYAGRVLDFSYVNIDTDTPKEMVYRVNAADIRPSAGGSTAASLSFAVWVGLYQAPTFAYLKPSSSPETGIGTAANQTRIAIEYTFANTGRMFAINNFKLVINGSESSYTIDEVKINTYGSGGSSVLSLSQSGLDKLVNSFTASTGVTVGGNTKNVTWTKTICTEINCLKTSPFAVIFSSATIKVFTIEILITFRLNSGDIRFVQVGIEGLDDAESSIVGKFAVRYFRA